MTKYPGKFLVLEGSEGSGKSTNILKLASWLQSRGIKVITTREPGGTPMAEEIRHLFKQERDERVDPMTEALLMWAARNQLISQVIRPALAKGIWCIADRGLASTFSYQVHARGMDQKTMFDPFVTSVMGDVWPDQTIILDVPVEVGMARASGRGELDRMEKESINFFQSVRQGYLEYLNYDLNAVRIDANKPQEQVFQSIQAAVATLLPAKRIEAPALQI